MNFLSFFPAGNQSITRKWMEHQPSKKEHLLTLALGVISASTSYYYKSSYLITGATCFSLSYGLKKESKNSTHIDRATMALGQCAGNASFVDGTPNPIRIMNFIVFSSLMGKFIRESWVKPSSIPNPNWKPYLIKAPFHYIAFAQSIEFLADVSSLSGKNISHVINIDSNNLEKTITITAILAISVSVSYMVPGSSLLFGTAAYGTLYGIIREAATQKSDIKEILSFVAFSFKLSLLFSIGGTVGKKLRSIVGPKDYSLPYSWPATIYLLPHYLNNFSAFLLLAELVFFHGKEQDLLDWIDRKFPFLDQYASTYMEILDRTFHECEDLKRLSVSDIKRLIVEKQRDLKIKQQEQNALEAEKISFSILVSNFVVNLCENKNQTVVQSVSEVIFYWDSFKEFYNKVTGKLAPEYTPKNKGAYFCCHKFS